MRRIASRIAITLALVLSAVSASAQSFPERQVRLIVPFMAGSSLDKLARHVAERLGEQLKGPVVVENITGAGGVVGVQALLNAPRDGHTLLIGTMGVLAINPHVYKQLPYDPLKDFAVVGGVTRTTNVVAVRPGLPVRNMAELIARAKANPGKISYGSAGLGSSSHLAGAMLASMAGIEMTHVPYRGSAAAQVDLLGDRIDMLIDAAGNYMSLSAEGKIRVLASTSRSRFPKMPEWPSVHDAGVPGYELTIWNAIMAPAGTPPARLEALRKAMQVVTTNPSFSAAVAPDEPLQMSVDEIDRYVRAEHARWGRIVKESGAAVSQ
jgi:tripartite-type tricarboxylate transporter receptor subunit TctC